MNFKKPSSVFNPCDQWQQTFLSRCCFLQLKHSAQQSPVLQRLTVPGSSKPRGSAVIELSISPAIHIIEGAPPTALRVLFCTPPLQGNSRQRSQASSGVTIIIIDPCYFLLHHANTPRTDLILLPRSPLSRVREWLISRTILQPTNNPRYSVILRIRRIPYLTYTLCCCLQTFSSSPSPRLVPQIDLVRIEITPILETIAHHGVHTCTLSRTKFLSKVQLENAIVSIGSSRATIFAHVSERFRVQPV